MLDFDREEWSKRITSMQQDVNLYSSWNIRGGGAGLESPSRYTVFFNDPPSDVTFLHCITVCTFSEGLGK